MSSPIKKIVNFKAKLIAGDMSYSGFIEKLSRNILYINTAVKDPAQDFTPGKTLEVKFQSDCGETISLSCKIKSFYKTPPYGVTDSLWMEIINPMPGYEEFYETL
ncbi:MAG: hypothetical protein HZA14_03345 [Nitrospirae bacterium]|nr:hypothetical protein [Nitrospirota bacterium]